MVPSRTEILVQDLRRRDVLAEVARERLVDAAGHRPTAAAQTGTASVPDVVGPLRAALASLRAVARWAHVG